jgi:hypothetical protein
MKDDIKSFRIETKKGVLFFDLKEDKKEDYLKITQSQRIKMNEFERQRIYVSRSDLQALRDAIDRTIKEFDKYNPQINKPKNSFPANAYKSWDKEKDFELQLLLKQNKSEMEIAKEMGRTRNSIRSRIKKISGLVD